MMPQSFTAFCVTYAQYVAHYILDFAWWFLLAASFFALCAAILSIVEKIIVLRKLEKSAPEALKGMADSIDTGLVQAFGALVDALVKAPAWFAMFLAGAFLVWLPSQTYADTCRPSAPLVKYSTSKETRIEITRTQPKQR